MSIDISVVIATHNQLARLRLVLCGLACQHFPKDRFEIIVVDDGCTDGTDAMLTSEYPDVHVVRQRPNVGRCQARNAGVEQARGQLVAFLDGDALPHPTWLKHLWAEWERGARQRYLCGFMYSLPLIEYLPDPQQAVFDKERTPSVLADFLLINRERVLITEDQIRYDFDGIHARAQEGGYPFDELKAMQDQVEELYSDASRFAGRLSRLLSTQQRGAAPSLLRGGRFCCGHSIFRGVGSWPIGCNAPASARALPAKL